MTAIYLDHNASTPIAPEVVEAMRPYLQGRYGNPSSLHWAARDAHQAVEAARSRVAELLGCRTEEVVFTSGGSEANNLALKGLFFRRDGRASRRLPNTLNVSFVGRVGAEVLAQIPDVAASTGSACHAGEITLSAVLKAMGTAPEIGMGAVRFSLGRGTPREEIEETVNQLRQALT